MSNKLSVSNKSSDVKRRHDSGWSQRFPATMVVACSVDAFCEIADALIDRWIDAVHALQFCQTAAVGTERRR
ncbi:hypothetical protein [Xanthomonas albilineans]|uniref:hypothetical protein n=1 Tax=Xanthomonas albilineans TaxID=29447 RepID=UPI0011B0E3C9|nr:hypothetical protein [Xanthomonas albilineans]